MGLAENIEFTGVRNDREEIHKATPVHSLRCDPPDRPGIHTFQRAGEYRGVHHKTDRFTRRSRRTYADRHVWPAVFYPLMDSLGETQAWSGAPDIGRIGIPGLDVLRLELGKHEYDRFFASGRSANTARSYNPDLAGKNSLIDLAQTGDRVMRIMRGTRVMRASVSCASSAWLTVTGASCACVREYRHK